MIICRQVGRRLSRGMRVSIVFFVLLILPFSISDAESEKEFKSQAHEKEVVNGNTPNVSQAEEQEAIRWAQRVGLHAQLFEGKLLSLYLFDLKEDTDLSPLVQLTDLKLLELRGDVEFDLNRLAGLDNLERLRLFVPPVSDLAPLAQLKNLKFLTLFEMDLDDLSPLKNIRNLETLELRVYRDDQLAAVAQLKNLKTLNVNLTAVNDLTPLANLTQLETLGGGFAKTADLSPLFQMPNLKILNLAGDDLPRLSPLANSTSLKTIRLFNVTDLWPLSPLSQLKELSLRRAKVNNLIPLTLMRSLEELDLSAARVDDLSPLNQLRNLRVLHLSNTQGVSPKDVARLRKALPNCRITGF